jgi:hypothetical protein
MATAAPGVVSTVAPADPWRGLRYMSRAIAGAQKPVIPGLDDEPAATDEGEERSEG